MAPTKSQKFNRNYVELISVSPKNHYSNLIEKAPIPVLKIISNAAIHASRGQVKLTPAQKKLFKSKQSLFAKLTNKRVGFAQKRKSLTQKGGSFIVPALISAVIGAIGSKLFSN